MKALMGTMVLLASLATASAQESPNGHARLAAKEIGLSYEYENYTKPSTRNWHYVSLYGAFRIGSTVLVPQINRGERLFPSDKTANAGGMQYQLDAYPKLSKHFYLFASYAYSGSGIFPAHKTALELFGSAGHGWEFSAGARYMYFNSNVISYTLSAGKYAGHYWVSLRGTLVDQAGDTGVQPAVSLTSRRYFKNELDYLQLTLNYGITTEDITYFQQNHLSQLLNSYGAGISLKMRIAGHIAGVAGISYRREEYRNNELRDVWGAQAGLLYRF